MLYKSEFDGPYHCGRHLRVLSMDTQCRVAGCLGCCGSSGEQRQDTEHSQAAQGLDPGPRRKVSAAAAPWLCVPVRTKKQAAAARPPQEQRRSNRDVGSFNFSGAPPARVGWGGGAGCWYPRIAAPRCLCVRDGWHHVAIHPSRKRLAAHLLFRTGVVGSFELPECGSTKKRRGPPQQVHGGLPGRWQAATPHFQT